MCLDTDPAVFGGGSTRPRRWTGEVRPASCSVDYSSSFNGGGATYNREWARAFDALYLAISASINSGDDRRLPQCGIQIEAGDAGGCGINFGVEFHAIEKNAASADSGSGSDELMIRREKVFQQFKRLRRDELSADFVARKVAALEQEHACTVSSCGDSRCAARRASAHDDQIEDHAAGFPFPAITPIR